MFLCGLTVQALLNFSLFPNITVMGIKHHITCLLTCGVFLALSVCVCVSYHSLTLLGLFPAGLLVCAVLRLFPAGLLVCALLGLFPAGLLVCAVLGLFPAGLLVCAVLGLFPAGLLVCAVLGLFPAGLLVCALLLASCVCLLCDRVTQWITR